MGPEGWSEAQGTVNPDLLIEVEGTGLEGLVAGVSVLPDLGGGGDGWEVAE